MTNTLRFVFYTVCSIYGSSFIILMLLLRQWMNSFIIYPDYESMLAMFAVNVGIIVGAIGMPVIYAFYRDALRKDRDWEKKCSEVDFDQR